MVFIEKNWMLILVLVLSGAMLLWPFVQRRLSAMKEIGNVNATQLINRQNAVLLDVRETKEMEGRKLPNAVHIPLSELGTRGAELSKFTARPIIVYCARGQRSRGAGAALERLGFTDVYQLNGGYRAWKDAGLPVVAA